MNIDSLERFVEAQEHTYSIALKEIQNGKKCSHWMWYVFPQLRGLGKSSTAYKYGISGLEEAKAYLDHPLLSERLYKICAALLSHKGKSVCSIFGITDAMKLKSSMTLFSLTTDGYTVFNEILDSFFDGKPDEITLKLTNG